MSKFFLLPDGKKVLIRPIAQTDSYTELTELLHRAYNATMDAGVVFYASHQSEEITRERVEAGACFVGVADSKIVATITTYHGKNAQCEWYRDPGVWFFGQFAVEPELQKSGIGRKMIDVVEEYVRLHNAIELALDTAENATNLIAYYTKRGFRQVGRVKWDDVDHHSIVLSKKLA